MSYSITKTEATDQLREILRPGDTVYTILRHVSSSGMTRHISTVVVRDDSVRDISWLVSHVTGYKVNVRNHDGLEVGGCGMDMGFHLVYSLSRKLFAGVTGNSADAGYMLNQRWL